jgi:hypothetical protein
MVESSQLYFISWDYPFKLNVCSKFYVSTRVFRISRKFIFVFREKIIRKYTKITNIFAKTLAKMNISTNTYAKILLFGIIIFWPDFFTIFWQKFSRKRKLKRKFARKRKFSRKLRENFRENENFYEHLRKNFTFWHNHILARLFHNFLAEIFAKIFAQTKIFAKTFAKTKIFAWFFAFRENEKNRFRFNPS